MNKTWKIILGVIVIVLAGAAVYFGSGSLFQGRLAGPSTIITPESRLPNLSISLNAASPSGSREVSSSDKMAVFDVCNNARKDVAIGSLLIGVVSDRFDINNDADIKVDGITVSEANTSEVMRIGVDLIDGGETIEKGQCETFEISLNTADLLAERGGVDDMLRVDLSALYDTNGAILTSVVNTPVNGNTLRY